MRPRDTDHAQLRFYATVAVVLTFLLIAVGGLVRATGSGEGCTGWPKCSATHWLPPFEYHAIIEYSHRMTAFLDVVLVGVLAVVAWRGYRDVPRIVGSALGAAGLIVAQAVLGGIVVKGALAPLLVTAHFATAMILTAVLVALAVWAFAPDTGIAREPDELAKLARIVAAGAFGLLLVGAYVRGENAGLVFPTWPLMGGRLVPRLSSTPAALQFAHRALALLVGVGVGVLAARGWAVRGNRPATSTLAMVAAGLYLLQVMIGATLVWSGRATPAIVAHVLVSSLVWGSLVATAVAARIPALERDRVP